MKDIKSSNIVKCIAYIVVPILVLIIMLYATSLILYINYEEDYDNYKDYSQTQRFADEYLYNIRRAVNITKNEKEIIEHNKNVQFKIMDSETNVQIEADSEENYDLEMSNNILNNKEAIQYNFYTIQNYDVLVISENGIIITNVEKTVETDTKDKIINYISSKKHFWMYDGTKLKTNIEKLSYDKVAYNGLDEIIKNSYQVYTALKYDNDDKFYGYDLMCNFVNKTYMQAPVVLFISSVLLVVVCIYIITSIGHKKETEEIYINSLDKIPYEIVFTVFACLMIGEIILLEMFAKMIVSLSSKMIVDSGISMSVLLGVVMYITIAITGVTTIRRIKAHYFFKNTIIYKLAKYVLNGLSKNINQTMKLALKYGLFILVTIVLLSWGIGSNFNLFWILILMAFWYYVFKKILEYVNDLDKIKQKISDMYNGDVDEILNENELKDELKQVAHELNDISSGLSNAIEEATKGERLKTELITNVSHDIKTPLTSIINYVDLMKQEKVRNPKIKEYLEILDKKSQRLKKLTEDLVEASKASSGNIKLTMETLNVKELIKQIDGEFEDKFNKKGLQIIESFSTEDTLIEADSRYMYRVLENMYVNISKYALENSRVYIDVIKTKETVQIALKNISQDKLNISVDELKERFIRGDSSRTTEGSGLGISIAESLTNLQKGKFDIYLDGDLFKVVIEFKAV